MTARVLGAGVLIRSATEDEVQAVEPGRRGAAFRVGPTRSFWFTRPERA